MKNPYLQFVMDCERLTREAAQLPLGGLPPLDQPPLPPNAPKALLFSPHPDDECISGTLPLRLRRELKLNVINVVVTQGSNPLRQPGRLKEAQDACHFLGFGLLQTAPHGLDDIKPVTRQEKPEAWSAAVRIIADILVHEQPLVIFMPHAADWNTGHTGTHLLVSDALQSLPADFSCYVVEYEFWGAMQSPNLMIELATEDLANLVAATTFHVVEVQRNPYHLSLPAWMQDNVRRGAELVGGQGGAAPKFSFAALYRLQKFSQGQLHKTYPGGKILTRSDDLAVLFSSAG